MIAEKEKKQYIAEVKSDLILNYGLSEDYAIELIHRFLIEKIDEDPELQMHDDISVFGCEMVRMGIINRCVYS